MQSRRSSRTSSAERRAGFSAIELLVTLAVTGLALSSVTQFLAIQAKHMRTHSLRLETQQAARASVDAIARDLRLAGACLPDNGEFIALDGTDGPTSDTVTIRTGLVAGDMSCIIASLTADATVGSSNVQIDDMDGFEVDMLAYIRHPNGVGDLVTVDAVGANSITFSPGATQDYPVGSGVYAVDERVYALNSAVTPPVLELTINRAAPAAFSAGLTDLQFKYVLNQNCPPCDVVDLPTTTAQWILVNEVRLTLDAETVGAVLSQDYETFSLAGGAKPRNLLPF